MNLTKALDEALKKLKTAKKQAKNVCNMNTEQGVADWASLRQDGNRLDAIYGLAQYLWEDVE